MVGLLGKDVEKGSAAGRQAGAQGSSVQCLQPLGRVFW